MLNLNFLANIDQSIKDNFKNKNVLVRVDYNVPFNNNKIITDDSRIVGSLATIKFLREIGARPVLCSHLGRPDLSCEQDKKDYSFAPFIKQISKILNYKVMLCDQGKQSEMEALKENYPSEKIILLENTRLFKGEVENDREYGQKLAEYFDFYVNDAFSVAHRNCATNNMITEYLPSFVGLELEKELTILNKILHDSEKPLSVIIGGAKISTKISCIKNLSKICDNIIIGGAMANNFLLANNIKVGKSLVEPKFIDETKDIIVTCRKNSCQLILPVDGVFAKEFAKDVSYRQGSVLEIEPDEMMLDFGSVSVANIINILDQSKTILCNGPLGAFEIEPFNKATNICFKHIANLVKANKAQAVIGGGDTLSAVRSAKITGFSHLSKGGGAFLEWLEGKNFASLQKLQLH